MPTALAEARPQRFRTRPDRASPVESVPPGQAFRSGRLGIGSYRVRIVTHGQLVDKDGQPVADPGPWAFRALAQNGYYRRPKGYVSPEEQILLDQEEVRALLAAWKKAEQAQFEVWRDGLSPEELARAMASYPGGPKDTWLRRVWQESHRHFPAGPCK